MGYYNIFKYFIRRLFSFLRSITGKLFVIFILLFFVLILYFCIDKGVLAAVSEYTAVDMYTSSNISTAESLVGSTIWNDDSYDIFLYNCADYGARGHFSWQKAVIYWKLDDTTNANCKYMINTNNIYLNGLNPPNYRSSMCLVNFSGSNISISNFWRKSIERGTPVQNGPFNQNNIDNPGWYGSNSCLVDDFICFNYDNTKEIYIKPIRSHYDICDAQGNVIVSATNPIPRSPYIENQSTTIENWSFDYLNINSGSVGYVYYDDLLDITSYADLNLKYTYDGITYTQSIPSGFLVDWSDDNFILEIPRTWLLSNVNIQNGKSVGFYLEVKKQNVSDNIYYLGTYTLSLTSAEQEQIQQDNDKALQGEILQTQQETNNKLDNLDNTINDSNVDDITSDSLPSDSTTDITADGVNGIFTSIYNAFCVGNAQDIVFPVPFTDKSITLSANYLSNSLTNANATFVITIIQAFWWYIISRFIIKDIMNKINKIKSGNIEDIETTNIRGDML